MTIKEHLEGIARAIQETPGVGPRPYVVMGVSDEGAVAMMAEGGAERKQWVYPEDWTVIESREITIGDVTIRAQTEKRPATVEEREAYQREHADEAKHTCGCGAGTCEKRPSDAAAAVVA